ncbi:MAG: hypothetical protein WC889_12240, partial [Myxococcota bacterium]
MRNAVLFMLAGVALIADSCTVDFKTPEEAKITCKTSADCPNGRVCSETIGQCVNPEELKKPPKLVGEAVVVPAVLRLEAVTTLAFEVNKELLSPPAVKVKVGTDRFMVLDEVASSGLRYVYTYKAAGDEPQNTDCPISFELTDRFGNRSGVLAAGPLTFDFTSPSVTEYTVEGSPAKSGAVVKVRFTASKVLGADPVVAFVGFTGGTFEKDATSENPRFVYTYTASGSEPEGAPGVEIKAEFTDVAGNTAGDLGLGKAEFLFTAPKLVGDPVAKPVFAKAGSLVTVNFEADKELGRDPVVKLGEIAMLKGDSSGKAYQYYYQVAGTEVPGGKKVEITLEDKAGNGSGAIAGPTVDLKFNVPSIAENSVTPLHAKSGAAVTAVFTSTAALSKDPVVKAGAMVFGKASMDGLKYTYTYQMAGTEDVGIFDVTADVVDMAGNEAIGLAVGKVIPDFTAPALVGTPVISRRYVKSGDTVTIGFTSGKVLGPDPVVRAGAMVFLKQTKEDNSWVYSYQVGGTEVQGATAVAISMVDEAGNESGEITAGSLVVDFGKPGVNAGAVIAPAYVKAGAVATLGFTAGKDLGADPVVTLGGAMNVMKKSGQSGREYVYTYMAAGTEGDGAKAVEYLLVDLAGNESGPVAGPSTEFDFRALGFENEKIEPLRIKGGGTFTLSLDVNKDIIQDTVTAAFSNGTDGGDMSCARDAGQPRHHTCTGVAPTAVSTSQYYTVTAKVTDNAQNEYSKNIGTIEVDNVPPEIADFQVTKAAKIGDKLMVVLTASEPLMAPPVLKGKEKAGAYEMAFGPTETTKGKISYTYLTGAVTTGIPPGEYAIQPFRMTDEAGNESDYLSPNPPSGDFKVESVPPVVSDVKPGKTTYSRNAGFNSAVVTFDCTKNVHASGTLTVNIGGRALVCDPPVEKTPGQLWGFTCRHTVDADDKEGVNPITVQAQDAAGNQGLGSSSVMYDFTPPALNGAAIASPAKAGVGSTITYTVNTSKPLESPPTLTITGPDTNVIAYKSAQPGATSFVYASAPIPDETILDCSIPGTCRTGSYTVDISMTDAVGNTSLSPLPGTPFIVDGKKPVIGGVTVTGGYNQSAFSKKPGFKAFSLKFTCPKDVKAAGSPASLIVKLGSTSSDTVDISSSCQYTSQIPLTNSYYTCTYDVSTYNCAGCNSGVKNISIIVSDQAGNTGSGSASATFDFIPPALASQPTVSPSNAGVGAVLTYTLNVSKPLKTDPVFTVTGPGGNVLVNKSSQSTSTNFIYSSNAIADETGGCAPTGCKTGNYTVAVTLTDNVDNQSVALPAPPDPLTAFSINANRPMVSGLAVSGGSAGRVFSKVTNHDGNSYAHMVLAFNTSKGVGAGTVSATVDGVAMNCGAILPAQTSFTCTYEVNTYSGSEGIKTINVTATDAYQNSDTKTATVTFDFTAPTAVSGTANPFNAALNDTQMYNLGTSEALLTAPVLNAGGPASITLDYINNTSYSYKHKITPLNVDGDYTVSTTLVDIVGNQRAVSSAIPGSNMDGFRITASLPLISDIQTGGRTRFSHVSNYNIVTLTFINDKELDDYTAGMVSKYLLVKIDGRTMGNFQREPSGAKFRYTYDYTVVGSEGEGLKTIAIEAVDEAGNYAFGSTNVTFDFTPPEVDGTIAVDLTRPANCPLANNQVTKITSNTGAAISFRVSEEIMDAGGNPLPVAVWGQSADNTVTISFNYISITGLKYVYNLNSISAGQFAGVPCDMKLTLRDVVGNQQTVTVPMGSAL